MKVILFISIFIGGYLLLDLMAKSLGL